MPATSARGLDPMEFLSRDTCQRLYDTILGMAQGGGKTSISVTSVWYGTARWARNRMHVAADTQEINVSIARSIRGASGSVETTQVDEDGLRGAVRLAESIANLVPESPDPSDEPYVQDPYLRPTLWDETTYSFGPQARTELMQQLIEPAEAAGMLSFGTLRIGATAGGITSSIGQSLYYPNTMVECSMTVRHPNGTASGWAGVNHYALGNIDPKAIAARALDKCLRSANPVAVEPGRYTVVLEPQAVADLTLPILQMLGRGTAETPFGPFGGQELGRSKINLPVMDRRLTLRADPMDPDGGFVPFQPYTGTSYRAVNWIDRGILRELSYSKQYALANLGLPYALENPGSFRLMPVPGTPTSTVDEMVANTARGLLVTRFSNVRLVDASSGLCTGYTRDGLWLIERGTISKAVKNFQFTESPLFVFNNVVDIGAPIRVFFPRFGHVAPAIRANDFSFTRLSDAV